MPRKQALDVVTMSWILWSKLRRDAWGWESRIGGEDLCKAIGVECTAELREVVHHGRVVDHLLIGSTTGQGKSGGYFVIRNDNDYERTRDHLVPRVKSINDAVRALALSWELHKAGVKL